MRPRFVFLLLLFFCPMALMSQRESAPPYRLYGGAAWYSNSFNGVPGARQALLGWDSDVEFPAMWHNVRFKINVSGTTGTNGGAPQKAFFVLGGFQYEHPVGRERLFVHGLVGDAGITRYWGPNSLPGGTASFAYLLGGGVDTPLSRHVAVRVEGDLQHTNLYLVQSLKYALPYRVAGMPNYMGRVSAGLVWTPRLGHEMVQASGGPAEAPESDLVFEDLNSVGHYHVFAGTWWSYLHVAGVEYDRNSWGTFLRARMDYVAEFLPVIVLRQPAKTDPWGDPLSFAHTTNPGVGIVPVGVRLLWRDGTRFQPYYIAKAGMIGFTHKALSSYASYENFNLQQATGAQIRLNDRWDVRIGVEDFHFSNGFLVPNNPGIDDMMYGGALVYRLHERQRGGI